VGDEGWLLDGAARVFRGEVPYRDFWPGYEPGRYYLLAGAFKLFGASVRVERLVLAPLVAVLSVLVYLIATRFVRGFCAVLPSLFLAIAPGPWHKVFLGVSICFFLLAAIRFLESTTARRRIVLIVSVAIAVWFRRDVGAMCLFGGSVVIWWTSRPGRGSHADQRVGSAVFRRFGVIAIFWLAALAPAAIWGVPKLVDPKFREGFAYHIRVTLKYHELERATMPDPGLANPFDFSKPRLAGVTLFGLFNPVICFWALASAIYRCKKNPELIQPRIFLIVAICGIALYHTFLLRPRSPHFLQSASIFYILFAERLSSITQLIKAPRKAALVRIGIGLTVLGLFTAQFATNSYYSGGLSRLKRREIYWNNPHAEIFVPRFYHLYIMPITDVLRRKAADGEVLCLPYCPMYAFLAGVPQAGYFSCFLPGLLEPQHVADLRDLVRQQRPAAVVMLERAPGGMPVAELYPEFYKELNVFYEPTFTWRSWSVLVPRSESAIASTDDKESRSGSLAD
jgi:hypothetical protein